MSSNALWDNHYFNKAYGISSVQGLNIWQQILSKIKNQKKEIHSYMFQFKNPALELAIFRQSQLVACIKANNY